MVVSTLLLKKLSQNTWSFNFIFRNFTQLFTCQSSQFTDTKIFGLSISSWLKIILIFNICIWLQISSIFTKAFTGLLLTTYSNIKYKPFAESLEDIYQDQRLEVHSYISEFVDELKTIYKMDTKMIDNIVEREEKFLLKYNIKRGITRHSVEIFEKIVTGQLVVICETGIRETFETKFIKWRKMLSVSDKKYLNFVTFHIVKNNNKLTTPLSSM